MSNYLTGLPGKSQNKVLFHFNVLCAAESPCALATAQVFSRAGVDIKSLVVNPVPANNILRIDGLYPSDQVHIS